MTHQFTLIHADRLFNVDCMVSAHPREVYHTHIMHHCHTMSWTVAYTLVVVTLAVTMDRSHGWPQAPRHDHVDMSLSAAPIIYVTVPPSQHGATADGSTSGLDVFVTTSPPPPPPPGTSVTVTSVHAARDLLRTRFVDRPNGVTILLAPGVHTLVPPGATDAMPIPLSLDARDSGKDGAPVVWAAADAHAPTLLTAGTLIPSSAWGPCPPSPQLHAATTTPRQGRGSHVNATETPTATPVCASLTALGVTDLGELTSGGLKDCQNNKTELFAGGQPLTLARWPNILSNGSWVWAHVANGTRDGNGFQYRDDEGCPAANDKWAAESDAWIHGYFHVVRLALTLS